MSQPNWSRIDAILALIVEEAETRTVPADFVSRLYAVEMQVTTGIDELMARQRADERAHVTGR